MTVGIYTIHACNNYGAMLQTYATQKALEKLGVEAEIVNYYPKSVERENRYLFAPTSLKNIIKNGYSLLSSSIKLKSQRFAEFHDAMRLSPRYLSLDEIYSTPPNYDLHLVGSDQVWNLEHGLSQRNYFFLDFLPDTAQMVSYASSFGSKYIGNDADNTKLHRLLSRFRAISVREEDAVEMLREQNITATQVMDPTFLLSQAEWSAVAGDDPIIKQDYVLAYGFGQKESTNKLIHHVKSVLGLPVIGISVGTHNPFNYDRFIQEAGPKEFLNLIKHAKFIITASYHGAAFAIHFRKNFIISKHPTRNSRMESMLKHVGLMDRLIDLNDENTYTSKNIEIDYSTINNLINNASQHSRQWLQDNIKTI